jgi:hypothetical protein
MLVVCSQLLPFYPVPLHAFASCPSALLTFMSSLLPICKITSWNSFSCLILDKSDYSMYTSMFMILKAWQQQSDKLANVEISKDEYDEWQ